MNTRAILNSRRSDALPRHTQNAESSFNVLRDISAPRQRLQDPVSRGARYAGCIGYFVCSERRIASTKELQDIKRAHKDGNLVQPTLGDLLHDAPISSRILLKGQGAPTTSAPARMDRQRLCIPRRSPWSRVFAWCKPASPAGPSRPDGRFWRRCSTSRPCYGRPSRLSGPDTPIIPPPLPALAPAARRLTRSVFGWRVGGSNVVELVGNLQRVRGPRLELRSRNQRVRRVLEDVHVGRRSMLRVLAFRYRHRADTDHARRGDGDVEFSCDEASGRLLR